MPSRAISRPIAWKTHAKISIPTRSACNQIKQDQRLDLAIPITLHGSLDTCVSAPRLSFSLSLTHTHTYSLPPSLPRSNRAVRMTVRRGRRAEREREGERENWGKGEREREKSTNERSRPLVVHPLLSVSLYLCAKRGAVSILGPLWERLRVRVCLHATLSLHDVYELPK